MSQLYMADRSLWPIPYKSVRLCSWASLWALELSAIVQGVKRKTASEYEKQVAHVHLEHANADV